MSALLKVRLRLDSGYVEYLFCCFFALFGGSNCCFIGHDAVLLVLCAVFLGHIPLPLGNPTKYHNSLINVTPSLKVAIER